MNLLDTSIDELVSYFGQDALDNDYYTATLRDVIIVNSKGERVESIVKGNEYFNIRVRRTGACFCL